MAKRNPSRCLNLPGWIILCCERCPVHCRMLAASLASTHSMPVTTHSRHSRCLGSKLHPTTTTTGDPDLKHWTLFSLCCWLRHSYLASLKAPIKHTWLVNFTVNDILQPELKPKYSSFHHQHPDVTEETRLSQLHTHTQKL